MNTLTKPSVMPAKQLNEQTTLCGYVEQLRQELNAVEKVLSTLAGKLQPNLSEPYPSTTPIPQELENPRSPLSVEVLEGIKQARFINRTICELTDRLDLP